MKVLFKLSTLCVLMAMLVASCSKDEMIPYTEEDPATRADSPLLITSPTELNYNNSIAGRTYVQTVNVKVAGLPALAMLTNFETNIQGPDAEVFTVVTPPPSLGDILSALLGNGVDIDVQYAPYEDEQPGDQDSAELLITASLLGMIMPVQTTVPLIGTIIAPTDYVSVSPQRATLAAAANGRRQYTVTVTFNNNIRVPGELDIEFSDAVLTGGGGIVDLNRSVDSFTVNGNVLTIVVNSDNLPARGSGVATVVDNISNLSITDVYGNPVSRDVTITQTLLRGQ